MSDPSIYSLVPKNIDDNLRFRAALLKLGAADREDARRLWIACKRDICFAISSFFWIEEPRETNSDLKTIPFVLYPFQEEAILAIRDAVGRHDLVIEKSRDMGASWMIVSVLTWLWLFHGKQSALLLSRKEDLVDDRGNPASLFGKIDIILKWLPGWLRPEFTRNDMKLLNQDSGAITTGESTNEFAGVGNRTTVVVPDEYSKMPPPVQEAIHTGTRDVTRSRIYNFTPNGAANKSYEVAHDPEIPKLTLHWSKHPEKAAGLYRVDSTGQIVLLDKTYWTPERVVAYQDAEQFPRLWPQHAFPGRKRFGFIAERPKNPRFDFRSPWYDTQCLRERDPRKIAQELDIDYHGSDATFFNHAILRDVIEKHARPPIWVGRPVWSADGMKVDRFEPDEQGPLRIWGQFDGASLRPIPNRKWVFGTDIAEGSTVSAASNSVTCIADQATGEKVAEYCISGVQPQEFCDSCVALANWYGGPEAVFWIWEANGPPGQSFTDQLTQVHRWRSNIYWRKKLDRISRNPTDVPGFWNQGKHRMALFTEYRDALQSEEWKNPSKRAVEECFAYVWDGSEQVWHSQALATVSTDPTRAKNNHSDHVIADALMYRGLKDKKIVGQVQVNAEAPQRGPAPVGSLKWRMEQHEARSRREQAEAATWRHSSWN